MKVTTLRFGRDLWTLLESEAQLVGTSVSQYVREAALSRAAAAAGARGESPFEALAEAAHGLGASAETDEERLEIEAAIGVLTRARARAARDDALALQAQSAQARTQASRKAARNVDIRRA
jgi:hypothetical protein